MSQKMNIVSKLHQPFVVDRITGDDWNRGPLVVEMDTTEACNLACPGCISEDLVSNATSFSDERLFEIGKEMYEIGVKAVVLIGGGEPLAHPKIGKFMEYLGEHDIHIGITTNGYFIPRYLETIANRASWTRVSMDAATQETFDKLRPSKDGKSKFDAIVKGMRDLAKIKKGKLGFSYLIRTEADGFGITSNIHEIYDAALLARDIGCDYFEVKPSYAYAGGRPHALVVHSKERMNEAKKQVEKLKDLDTDSFKVITAINLEDSLNCVQTYQNKDYHFCPAAHLRTLICPSGVYVCPYWRGKTPYRIGDAKTQSLEDIWHSEKRKNIMNQLDPAIKCNFHCLRNETNKEVIRIQKTNGEGIDIIPEYDRFF
ncbi:MAG: radical SAM protein [Butyrivibrio sp.]|uniref:radical SAM protein n=1 Tax=Butyrivibrio sp. TaxID=28121 RepID=UPI0025F78AF5|nr:radical SAM protein [Butyrivibrio sp.]MCR5770689.1 radical SAM protein [Butyrivibrio sp.]